MDFQFKKAPSLCWLRGEEHQVSLVPRKFSAAPEGKIAFFAPDFALNFAEPWIVGDEGELALDPKPLPSLAHRAEPSSAEFERIFEDIQARIQAKAFEKVVPIVTEHLQFSENLEAGMFARAISNARPFQYNYGFAFNDEGMVGITPELLFQVEGESLTTMALAGTGKANGPSLLENPKERFEHQLVIDHIVRELAIFGEAEVGTTEERVYGPLKHLYTPIKMRLKREPDFMKLVVELHPTAALGGWPRRPAIEWLEAQTFHKTRKRFGAPFGYLQGNKMTCVVAIRGLQWSGRDASLISGAGIVGASVALSEWNELALKRQAIALLLGLEL